MYLTGFCEFPYNMGQREKKLAKNNLKGNHGHECEKCFIFAQLLFVFGAIFYILFRLKKL